MEHKLSHHALRKSPRLVIDFKNIYKKQYFNVEEQEEMFYRNEDSIPGLLNAFIF